MGEVGEVESDHGPQRSPTGADGAGKNSFLMDSSWEIESSEESTTSTLPPPLDADCLWKMGSLRTPHSSRQHPPIPSQTTILRKDLEEAPLDQDELESSVEREAMEESVLMEGLALCENFILLTTCWPSARVRKKYITYYNTKHLL